MARSTYYYWLRKMSRPEKYKEVKEEMKAIFQENKGRYGYRRMTMELRNRGYKINHKTVQKLMRVLGIQGIRRKMRRFSTYKGTIGKIADNLLKRDFKAEKPNEKWATDVTRFVVNDEKLYLSLIIDLYNGEIVSYNLSRRTYFSQVTDMLERAFEKIPDGTNLILHSDQGWQYQMREYQEMLKEKGIRQSMSRKGNCLDNAVAENFFGILKTELFYENIYESIEELEKDIAQYIEYYNNRRIKSKLKGMSPVEYRLHSLMSA